MQDNIVHQIITHLLDIFYPPRDEEILVRLCSEDKLSILSSPKEYGVCTPSATAILPFSNKTVRALIHEAKYHSNSRAFSLLGSVLRDYLLEICAEDGFGKITIIPIPISSARRKARGYNQTEKIALHAISEDMQVETDLLKRVIDKVSQTKLSRAERLKNMRGAFGAAHPLDPDHTYIIFDDVITTGATMHAAVNALARGGATHIIPLALAH